MAERTQTAKCAPPSCDPESAALCEAHCPHFDHVVRDLTDDLTSRRATIREAAIALAQGDTEHAQRLLILGIGDRRGVAKRWRHKKRGTIYTEIGRAELQAANGYATEGAMLVVYRGDDGKLWARRSDEFEDGRFERVSAP